MFREFIPRPHFQRWYKIHNFRNTTSAFWDQSSIVYGLTSVTTDETPFGGFQVTSNFRWYGLTSVTTDETPLGVFKLLQIFCGWGNVCIYVASLPVACSLHTQAGKRALRGNIWNPPSPSVTSSDGIFEVHPLVGYFQITSILFEGDVCIHAAYLMPAFSHKQDDGPFGVTFEISP